MVMTVEEWYEFKQRIKVTKEATKATEEAASKAADSLFPHDLAGRLFPELGDEAQPTSTESDFDFDNPPYVSPYMPIERLLSVLKSSLAKDEARTRLKDPQHIQIERLDKIIDLLEIIAGRLGESKFSTTPLKASHKREGTHK